MGSFFYGKARIPNWCIHVLYIRSLNSDTFHDFVCMNAAIISKQYFCWLVASAMRVILGRPSACMPKIGNNLRFSIVNCSYGINYCHIYLFWHSHTCIVHVFLPIFMIIQKAFWCLNKRASEYFILFMYSTNETRSLLNFVFFS